MCDLPDCEECNLVTWKVFELLSVIAVLLVIQLIYSALRVLRTMNDRSHRPCAKLPCCNYFCLCDASMFKSIPSSFSKRSKRHRLLVTLCPHLRLPPMVLFLATVLSCGCFVVVFYNVFSSAITDIGAVLPEELFPSDHLMLTVHVEVKPSV